jgi:hypothetical protein
MYQATRGTEIMMGQTLSASRLRALKRLLEFAQAEAQSHALADLERLLDAALLAIDDALDDDSTM